MDKDEAATTGSLVVMDMGTHVFKDLPEPNQLYQVLAPGLEERARVVPPLSTSEQLSPGGRGLLAAGVALEVNLCRWHRGKCAFLQLCQQSGTPQSPL